MDSLRLLEEARAAGLTVTRAGDRLHIRGPRSAEPIARQLIACKNDVLNVLTLAPAPDVMPADLPPDWHYLWDERAAIMEFDGGLPRERAEALALSHVLEEMRQAGIPSGDATCL